MGTYSKLHDSAYKKIRENFPEFVIRENVHPDWLVSSTLTRLELDIYIEDINTAIEIQGEQHYRYIPHFHRSPDGYLDQKRRDEEKRDLCAGRGVRLIEVSCQSDLDSFIYELKSKISNQRPVPTKECERLLRVQEIERQQKENRERKNERRKEILTERKKNRDTPEYRAKLDAKSRKKNKITLPKPGNRRQRKYARETLKFEQTSETTWKVWGGRDEHIVVKSADSFSCDCLKMRNEGGHCSHILKVMLNE